MSVVKRQAGRRNVSRSAAVVAGVAGSVALLQAGCASAPPITDVSAAYTEGLARSARGPHPNQKVVEQGIRNVKNLFENYSTNSIRRYAEVTYADSLYFRDGFRELTSRRDVVEYLLHGAKPLRECTFEFQPGASNGHDHYLRWIMRVSLRSDPEGHLDEAVGMSHIRFGADGKVVFQQDYWDPSDVLYRRIPIANGLIRMVKKRL